MTIFLLTLAGISLLYFVILVVFATVSSAFVWFWPAFAAACFGLAWFREHFQSPLWLKAVFWTTMGVILLLFVLVEGVIIRHCFDQGEPGLDYLIVLGAQVRGTEVSHSLKMRLDEAADYLEENPDTRVIVSGGQGSGEDITEAQDMEEYLRAKGIAAERILPEDRAVNTEENLRFSMGLMEGEHPTVGIVTNDFHVFRSVQMAKRMGLDACGIAAPSMPALKPHYLVREFLAVIKYLISGTL